MPANIQGRELRVTVSRYHAGQIALTTSVNGAAPAQDGYEIPDAVWNAALAAGEA